MHKDDRLRSTVSLHHLLPHLSTAFVCVSCYINVDGHPSTFSSHQEKSPKAKKVVFEFVLKVFAVMNGFEIVAVSKASSKIFEKGFLRILKTAYIKLDVFEAFHKG